jgi:hypothetical protein
LPVTSFTITDRESDLSQQVPPRTKTPAPLMRRRIRTNQRDLDLAFKATRPQTKGFSPRSKIRQYIKRPKTQMASPERAQTPLLMPNSRIDVKEMPRINIMLKVPQREVLKIKNLKTMSEPCDSIVKIVDPCIIDSEDQNQSQNEQS